MLRRSPWFAAAWRTVLLALVLGTACLPALSDAETPTWLVLLYFDADDEMLEHSIWQDFNEAELVGSSDRVTIIAQFDRYAGGFDGDGDWSSTRRYRVEKDDDLFAIGSPVVMPLGEVNMGDPHTLVTFARWAIENYPADRVALILSDHGSGWPGGWTDEDPAPAEMLDLYELDQALQEIRDYTGIDHFDVVGFDACLMSHLEVASALAPHANVMVASQEVEPTLGWAYAAFLQELASDPAMTGSELAESIVDTYLNQDVVATDDRARVMYYMELFYTLDDDTREFIRTSRASDLGRFMQEYEVPPTSDLLNWLGSNETTLAAVDLTRVEEIHDALDDLVFELQGIDQAQVAWARAYAQSFESVFGDDVPPSYIDLAHFARLIQEEVEMPATNGVTEHLVDAIDQAVLVERHGAARPGASGLSIYFPNAELFGRDGSGEFAYRMIADRFADRSVWDDFLVDHYSDLGTGIDVAPGRGEITIEPIFVTDAVVAPGEIAVLKTEIMGDNIGFVYLFVGQYFEEYNSILIVDQSFVEQERREVGGVYYPDWPQGEPFELPFVWEAILFKVHDGQTSEFALIPPDTFGASSELTTYSVDGIYTFTDSGETREAAAIFQDGELQRVLGFSGLGGVGAPRQIQIRPGDTFTAYHHWLDILDDETEHTTTEGPTFTFGKDPLWWEFFPAFPGEYLVGLQVEDLEGEIVEEIVWITISDDPNLLWTEGTLFREDFLPWDSDWAVSDWGTGSSFYLEDTEQYALWVADPASVSFSWSPYWEAYPSDFIAEVDAALYYGPQDSMYGILWGPDSETFYAFEVSADGYCKLDYMLDGEWQPFLLDWTECPEALYGYSANQLRVVVEGDEVTLIVNEGIVATVIAPNLGPCRIGVIAETYELPDIEVYFDNFQVWEMVAD